LISCPYKLVGGPNIDDILLVYGRQIEIETLVEGSHIVNEGSDTRPYTIQENAFIESDPLVLSASRTTTEVLYTLDLSIFGGNPDTAFPASTV